MVPTLAAALHLFRSWCQALLFVSALHIASASSVGEAMEAGPAMHFDLPAQPLQQALSNFGALTGHSVLVDSTMTQGLTASAVQGDFAPQAALRRLLGGTGLSARYSARDAFTLVTESPADAASANLPSGGDANAQHAIAAAGLAHTPGAEFAGALQASIHTALCAAQPDTFGRYRAALQLWFGPEGRVRRAHLLESSGVKARDEQLLERLRGLSVGHRLPPELAQPITVLLSPRNDPAATCRSVRGAGG